jgi:hypothetical protein
VKLEDSTGKMVDNPTPEQIEAAIGDVGSRTDHCILHLPGESFVQTAGSRDRLFVQYSDGGEIMESDRIDFDAATVARIFVDAMEGSSGWKSDYVFASAGGGAGDGASEERRGARMGGLGRLGGLGAIGTGAAAGDQAGTGASGSQSMKDQLLSSVKREVNREVSRGVGKLVRNVFRSVSGR